MLLAAVSPIFEEQFHGKYKSEEVVDIAHSEPEAFRKLLEYIYKGKSFKLTSTEKFSSINTIKLVFSVMSLADRYMIWDLKEICQATLLSSTIITEENIFDIVKVAGDHTHLSHLAGTMRKNCAPISRKTSLSTTTCLF